MVPGYFFEITPATYKPMPMAATTVSMLQSDGAIKEVACWAHTRRYWRKVCKEVSARAHYVLAIVAKLYKVEYAAAEKVAAVRQSLREEQSRPLLNDLKTWLDAEVFLPKSLSGKAAAYTLNQWDALNRYLEDGNLSIDNNASERAIRPVAIDRKNGVRRQQTRRPLSCDPDVPDRQLQSQSRGAMGLAQRLADLASARGNSGIAAAKHLSCGKRPAKSMLWAWLPSGFFREGHRWESIIRRITGRRGLVSSGSLS